jgi:ABC-type bacteriocin/lantibiotic exporter with double-glycine peptidase domain
MRTAILLFLMAWAVSPKLPGQTVPDEGPAFSCGLNAAYIFLNKTGHHAPYAELLREFGEQDAPDSLLAIKNVLGMHGCDTVGVKADADFFLANKGPAIVHLQLSGYSRQPENHFSFLVAANKQTGAEFLDPVFSAQAPSFVTWVNFQQSYQGSALILK